jgi:hypothetical protein
LFDLNFAIWNRGMNSNHLPHASTSSTSLMDTNTWLWPDSTKSPVFQHQSVQGTDGQKRTDQVELHMFCFQTPDATNACISPGPWPEFSNMKAPCLSSSTFLGC